MPAYGGASESRLITCRLEIQQVMREVVKHVDNVIMEGHRGQADQDEYFRTGKSKVKWPDGNHNKTPSDAVDAAPYPIDWDDMERFYFFGGYVLATAASMGYRFRWGGDWDMDTDLHDQSFFDLPHFEYKGML